MPSTCVSEAKAVPAPVISARRNKDSFFLIVKSLNSCRAQLLMVDKLCWFLFSYFLIRVHFSNPFMCRLSLGRLPLVARSNVLAFCFAAILMRVHFLQCINKDIHTTKARTLFTLILYIEVPEMTLHTRTNNNVHARYA